jgi:uncharacterized SAM-binding protein YcdF (DUF218 family)
MRALAVFFDDPSELFLPNSLHVLALLLVLSVLAFHRRGTPLARLRYPLLVAVAWSSCLSTPGVANALVNHLEGGYPPVSSADADDGALIVVLSSAATSRQGDHYEVTLDLAGWERTWASIRLWRRLSGQLLFVGGPTPDGRTSAAERMAAIAMAAGVPSSVVHIETQSRNTYENLLFSREQIVSRGGHAWLVSSAMHLPRAMAVGQKLGLRLRPYPCDWRGIELVHWYAWLPSSGGPAAFQGSMHELMGLAYYHLKGYTD